VSDPVNAFLRGIDCAVRDHYALCRRSMRMHALHWKTVRTEYPGTACWALEQAIWWRQQSKPFEGHPATRRRGA